jgi:ketosteroid isomerase-like protein
MGHPHGDSTRPIFTNRVGKACRSSISTFISVPHYRWAANSQSIPLTVRAIGEQNSASVRIAIKSIKLSSGTMKTPDPQLRQQLDALVRNFDEARNNNDAAAMAALFTEDAIIVTDTGPIYGREAIQKYHEDLFKQFRCSNSLSTADQYSPHSIGTAGNERYSSGEWSVTVQGETGDPIQLKGYFSCVDIREGNTWKCRMQTFNITPAPTPSA